MSALTKDEIGALRKIRPADPWSSVALKQTRARCPIVVGRLTPYLSQLANGQCATEQDVSIYSEV
jgi:hypothetical protein